MRPVPGDGHTLPDAGTEKAAVPWKRSFVGRTGVRPVRSDVPPVVRKLTIRVASPSAPLERPSAVG